MQEKQCGLKKSQFQLKLGGRRPGEVLDVCSNGLIKRFGGKKKGGKVHQRKECLAHPGAKSQVSADVGIGLHFWQGLRGRIQSLCFQKHQVCSWNLAGFQMRRNPDGCIAGLSIYFPLAQQLRGSCCGIVCVIAMLLVESKKQASLGHQPFV